MNPRSKLRDKLREATSDAILTAAEQVFARDGLHAAKVDDIAVQAGVSVGTLYNYFPDREGLLQALMEVRRGDLLEHIDEMLARDSGQPFVAQLEDFLRAVFDHFDTHRAFFQIVFQAELQKGKLPGSGAKKDAMQQMYERANAVIQRGLNRGELRPELADLYPGLLMGLVRSVMIVRVFHASGALAGRAGELAHFFMKGAGAQHV